jgi:hypothetical protein
LIPGTVSQLLICVSEHFVRQFTNRRGLLPRSRSNRLFRKDLFFIPGRL